MMSFPPRWVARCTYKPTAQTAVSLQPPRSTLVTPPTKRKKQRCPKSPTAPSRPPRECSTPMSARPGLAREKERSRSSVLVRWLPTAGLAPLRRLLMGESG
ncbi:hypothetical protein CALCODRAFT_379304 [Calocera cornea HHB12733]|uniref:Uncharacterized protein n=1 Tax=Calocera cornea HHB12733 TaxID=1353952 RepID=A0A165EDP6_9BASI|nr:hypothetical protein CALCODRAFT_379304 [Calocera cornea HHB12733]